MQSPGRRIAIVGSTGSGKTTMARRLAEALTLPHVELDSLFWGPDWTPSEREEFRRRVTESLSGDCWVADGNYYSSAHDLVWKRAETIVWLDLPLPVVLLSLARRTLRRIVRREELWQGNRERLHHVFARDNLFLWAIKTQPRHRERYGALLSGSTEHEHLTVIHLQSRAAADRWLAQVTDDQPPAPPPVPPKHNPSVGA